MTLLENGLFGQDLGVRSYSSLSILILTMGMSGRQISLGCIAIALMVATWEVMAKLLQSSDLNNTRP
jgi:hypothetical protein